MRDIADYLVGGYADSVYPDNLRIFHYGNCPVLKGPIVIKVQYNKHGEYVGTTGNISIASGSTRRICLEDYVPYDGIPGNAIVIWLVSEGAPTPPPPTPPPTPTGVEIPSAFQPYVVNISGLSTSQDVSWKGVPVLIWWGEGFVTLKGWIKVAEQHATKAGQQISWNEYIIETGQTRTFSNVAGQDMSIYLLETKPEVKYSCPYCPATFGTQKELNDHIASQHPSPPPPPPGKFTWNGCKLIMSFGVNVDAIKAAGFNTAGCYTSPSDALLDECLRKGLWLIPDLHVYFYDDAHINLSGAINFVNRWKHHPAVAAWYFLDEPDIKSSKFNGSAQQGWYNALKAADPNHDFFTIFTAHIEKHWNPNAFDHVGFDTYPYHKDTPNWEPRLRNSCNVCRSRSGGIGGMAVAQAWYNGGNLNPTGIVDDMLRVFQEYGIGTQKDGYGMYAWGGYGTPEQDSALRTHVKAVNASYPWPHAPPGEGVVYSCPYCGATFSTQAELDAHIASEHHYTCPHCGAVFHTQADLDAHIASEHPEETFTTKQVTCTLCSSVLRVTISSIAGNNKTLTCPLCQTTLSQTGTKVEIVSTPVIDQLRADIRTLDEQIEQAEGKIVEAKAKVAEAKARIDAMKELLGM